MRKQIPAHWAVALLIQIAMCSVVAAILLLLIVLVLPVEVRDIAYNLCMWILYPIASAGAAALAVRMGLHHYLAWIAPGICLVIVHIFLIGRLPFSPGIWMLTTLLGFVGAAVGEEQKKRRRKKKCPKT